MADNDNVCAAGDADGKLVGKEMSSELGSVNAGDVTANAATLAITKSDGAEFF
jgi:hypothetical protein